MAKWAKPPSNFVGSYKGKLLAIQHEVLIRLFTLIIDRSPVDTGTFKSSWVVGIGTVSKPENIADVTGAPAYARLQVVKNSKLGDVVQFVNHQPYGILLEYYSWSKKAPNGMVRISLRQLPAILQEVVGELG